MKKVRLARGLTQDDMRRFGFNPRHYQRLEGAKQGINLHTLHRVAEAFRVNIKEFFD